MECEANVGLTLDPRLFLSLSSGISVCGSSLRVSIQLNQASGNSEDGFSGTTVGCSTRVTFFLDSRPEAYACMPP
jgi:hypothetical protein